MAATSSHITETVTVRLRREKGIEDPTPAHRLDRLTSGALVFTVPRIHAEDRTVPLYLIARELAVTDTLSGETWVFTAPRERTVH